MTPNGQSSQAHWPPPLPLPLHKQFRCLDSSWVARVGSTPREVDSWDRAPGKGWGIPGKAKKAGGKVMWPGALALTLLSVLLQCDRLAADCAQELRRHGVSYVSLWPGLVQTELLKEAVVKNNNADDPLLKQVGEGRKREAGNAEDSASPSSMTRQ